jgi:hypothetical protein
MANQGGHMRNTRFHRPSPAMLVAFAALLIALGGTSYAALRLPANSVGTKQLKKNAVTGAKVKNGSLATTDFKSGQIPAGPRGAQGPQGPQGLQGPQGPQGTSKVPTITVRTGATEMRDASANCQAGEAALGGGGSTSDGFIYDTSPNVASGTPTGWVASAEMPDGNDASVQAWVICGAP